MNIDDLLDKCTASELVEIVLSNRKHKNTEGASKVKIRPVNIKNKTVFQASEYVGTQVLHRNMSGKELAEYVKSCLNNDFKQGQFAYTDGDGQVLCGSKGNMTVKYKKSSDTRTQKDLSHNKQKKYILEEGKPVGFLIDLGVMTKEGKIVASRYDKFRQINRFLEFIEDVIPYLSKDREQTIIDFGCGKSYLTFAMYYYLKEIKGLDIRIIGLDLKKDVSSVDMVVTLHACDTATDYALAKAVKWGAKVILSVPCCQHEANGQIQSDELMPVLKYGILKERMSSILTDAIRANRREIAGYQTQILEFIDMEHTPKNLLIRGVYTGKKADSRGVDNLEDMFNLNLTLDRLMEDSNEP